jgi:hypothetical protein
MASNGNPPPRMSHQDRLRLSDAVLQSPELLMRAAVRTGLVRCVNCCFLMLNFLALHLAQLKPIGCQSSVDFFIAIPEDFFIILKSTLLSSCVL